MPCSMPIDWATAIARALGCPPLWREWWGVTWPCSAVFPINGHLNVVRYLCELPLDPLRMAAMHGHVNVVQYLCELRLDRGSDMVACKWALQVAARNGHKSTCASCH